MQKRTYLTLFTALGFAACGGPGRQPAIREPQPAAMPAPMGASGADREQTADQQVVHALSRLTFGARPGDVEKVRAMGVDNWIDQQLHPERIDDSALDLFVSSNYQHLYESPGALEQKYPPPGQLLNQLAARNGGGRGRANANPNNPPARPVLSPEDSMRLRESQQGLRQITTEVQSARVARAVLTERQLLEVMTDFWLNHFTVYDAKGPRERYMLGEYENKVIRPNALGKFRTLLGAVAHSDAMLFYLDNWQSQADSSRPRLANAPGRGGGGRAIAALRGGFPPVMQPPLPQRGRAGLNENYGRELLELHTLGVDGGYTQQDVINAARALTGWTIRGPQQGSGFQFAPFMHDAGEKVLLGHTLRAGRGIEDGEEVLDIVARHPSTAHYIAFKLARRFVSDSPSTALVDRAAATFSRTDGDIRETLRTIIASPEFFARSAYRSKVKSPFEVVTSAARALGAAPDPTPRMAGIVGQLGQPIYGHQTPNGWPETGEAWMNTGAILNRINFGMLMASGRVQGASPFGIRNSDALRSAPLDKQVDGVVSALLGGDVSPETRAVLVSGENPLGKGAAGAMDDPMSGDSMGPPGGGRGGRGGRAGPQPLGPPNGPPGAGGRGFPQLPALKGLPLVVGLALGSPEFQRR